MPIAGGDAVDVMRDMDADTPSKPFGGPEEIAFTPDGKEAQKEYDPKKHDSKLWAQGRLFKRPNDPNWTPANTPRGIAIYQEFFFKNNNTEPTPKDSILQH